MNKLRLALLLFLCFFNDTATTEIYTLSLHDALPISVFFGSSSLSAMAPQPPRDFENGTLNAGARPCCGDRKSTRLNSSHANISYAVFCLKKKNTSLPASCFPHIHTSLHSYHFIRSPL